MFPPRPARIEPATSQGSDSGETIMVERKAAAKSETEAFLALFEEAWRPLDPQVRFVISRIYGQLRGRPPPAQIPVDELRRINARIAFDRNADLPAPPQTERR